MYLPHFVGDYFSTYICEVINLFFTKMKTTKVSLIDVFSGSPWEVELIKGLLEKANVQTQVKDEAEMRVAVPSESYTTAMEILASRI
jgi:hypothetical protein